VGLIGVAEQRGRALRRQALSERLDGLLGPRDLPDRAAGEPRRPSHTALERPLGGAVDVGLKGLGDDRIAHEQALADQAIDEQVGVPGGGDLPSETIEPD